MSGHHSAALNVLLFHQRTKRASRSSIEIHVSTAASRGLCWHVTRGATPNNVPAFRLGHGPRVSLPLCPRPSSLVCREGIAARNGLSGSDRRRWSASASARKDSSWEMGSSGFSKALFNFIIAVKRLPVLPGKCFFAFLRSAFRNARTACGLPSSGTKVAKPSASDGGHGISTDTLASSVTVFIL